MQWLNISGMNNGNTIKDRNRIFFFCLGEGKNNLLHQYIILYINAIT